nr:hypothetical protein FVER53263_20483 [Fusarium verticillioides]
MASNSVHSTPDSSAMEDAVKFYQAAAQGQPNPSETSAYKSVDPLAFEMSRVPMRTPRPLKIVCCGAGISGLNLAHEVETGSFTNCELKIYEKNSDLGGTWFENRYPGCAFYTGSQDIYNYLKDVADQHNLGQYIKLSHKIIGAKWFEERQKWQIQIVQTDGRELVVSDGETKDGEKGEPFIEECDIFINASGAYNNWRWPAIPNRETYRGNMMHSAAWPDADYVTGRTVTLIGN